MKTICITSFHGLVSRVLEGGVLQYLLEANIRVILLVPDFKVEYFRATFTQPGITVVGVNASAIPRHARILHRLTFALLNTNTMRIIRRSHRGSESFLSRFASQMTATSLGRFRMIRVVFRFVSVHFVGKEVFADLFEIYKPDLVCAMDIKHIMDTQLVIEAKKHGIPTVGMVRSWDYLTAKGIIRVSPDTLVVHNNIIKEEARRYADMPLEKIIVVGMPHFDAYTTALRQSREEFCAKFHINLQSRIVFLAPWGEKFSDIDYDVFSLLCSAVEAKRLPSDLIFLVRVPPGDALPQGAVAPCARIIFDYPGVVFEGGNRKQNEMNLADIKQLANSIFHSDAVISCSSTIAIDAAAFDKPIILMAFDGYKKRPYYESVRHYFDFDHMQNVIKTGGVRLAKNEESLIAYLNDALSHPSEGHEGRVQIIREQCGDLDGKASKRLAQVLIDKLKV